MARLKARPFTNPGSVTSLLIKKKERRLSAAQMGEGWIFSELCYLAK